LKDGGGDKENAPLSGPALDRPCLAQLSKLPMTHPRIALIVIGVILLVQTATPQRCLGDAPPTCTGKYKDKTPSPAELKMILQQHAAWEKDYGWLSLDDPKAANDSRRANLCGADLKNAPLQKAHLSGANLDVADLSGATLIDAQLSKAKLAYADLTKTLYAPVSEPPDSYVAGIKGLATIRTKSGEQIGIVQLRKLLKDAGLGDSEREATYAIQRNITRDELKSPYLSTTWTIGTLRLAGFDWTTAYGLRPDRSLRLILVLSVMIIPLYMIAMLRPTATSGIVQVSQPAGSMEPLVNLLTRRN
jgi:hypothetical protein